MNQDLERRGVSVLRIGFPEFPSLADRLQPGEADERLEQLLDLLLDPVLRSEGTCLLQDQAVISAVWNAPHAQSEHARLAMGAAHAAMRAAASAARRLDLRVYGGLATGDALVGTAGSRFRRGFVVLGGAMEAAAALFRDASPNRLAVSSRAWLEAGRLPYAGDPDPVEVAY